MFQSQNLETKVTKIFITLSLKKTGRRKGTPKDVDETHLSHAY